MNALQSYRWFPNIFVTMVKIISTILVGNGTKATIADSRDSLKSDLLCAKELSDNELTNLCASFCRKTIKELHAIMKSVCVRLTGSSCKTDVTDQLIAMAKIGAVKSEAIDGDTGQNFTEVSYITDEVKNAL